MRKKFDVYGIGNALVDVQFQVAERALQELSLDKGGMQAGRYGRAKHCASLLRQQCLHIGPAAARLPIP